MIQVFDTQAVRFTAAPSGRFTPLWPQPSWSGAWHSWGYGLDMLGNMYGIKMYEISFLQKTNSVKMSHTPWKHRQISGPVILLGCPAISVCKLETESWLHAGRSWCTWRACGKMALKGPPKSIAQPVSWLAGGPRESRGFHLCLCFLCPPQRVWMSRSWIRTFNPKRFSNHIKSSGINWKANRLPNHSGLNSSCSPLAMWSLKVLYSVSRVARSWSKASMDLGCWGGAYMVGIGKWIRGNRNLQNGSKSKGILIW